MGRELSETGNPDLWAPTGDCRPKPELQVIEMTSPKLPFNSEVDTFTKYLIR